jgi:hypothetical protein
LGFFGLVVLPSHHINSSIRRGAMLAASKRNERHARPFKFGGCWVFVVLPSHHINSSIRRGAMLAASKQKTCPPIQVEGGCLGFSARVALAPHNSSIRRGAMLAGVENERHARPFKLRVAVWVLARVAIAHHINSSIPLWRDAGGFEAKRKTMPRHWLRSETKDNARPFNRPVQ